MSILLQDIGYGLRMLLKNKGVTVIAITALALGIGANTAIFSLIDAVLLRPLPFAQPEELVQVFGTAPELEKTPSSPADFLEWREQNRVFERIAAETGQVFTLLGGGTPERLNASRVSADFFDLLGVRPAMGTESVAQWRFNMVLLGLFAAIAMILAAIALYGVIACSVAQRTKEIGIRMAPGAGRTDMLAMILRHGLGLVFVGVAIGVVASLGATRLLRSFLFGIGTTDLLTYAAVIGLLGLAALLASYIPARRAMRVDPMEALRYE